MYLFQNGHDTVHDRRNELSLLTHRVCADTIGLGSVLALNAEILMVAKLGPTLSCRGHRSTLSLLLKLVSTCFPSPDSFSGRYIYNIYMYIYIYIEQADALYFRSPHEPTPNAQHI